MTPLNIAIGKLEECYRTRSGNDVSPDGFLEAVGDDLDEDELAILVELDGRLRLRSRLDVTLDRYMELTADLRTKPIILDAAIDVTLRSLSRSSCVIVNRMKFRKGCDGRSDTTTA